MDVLDMASVRSMMVNTGAIALRDGQGQIVPFHWRWTVTITSIMIRVRNERKTSFHSLVASFSSLYWFHFSLFTQKFSFTLLIDGSANIQKKKEKIHSMKFPLGGGGKFSIFLQETNSAGNDVDVQSIHFVNIFDADVCETKNCVKFLFATRKKFLLSFETFCRFFIAFEATNFERGWRRRNDNLSK